MSLPPIFLVHSIFNRIGRNDSLDLSAKCSLFLGQLDLVNTFPKFYLQVIIFEKYEWNAINEFPCHLNIIEIQCNWIQHQQNTIKCEARKMPSWTPVVVPYIRCTNGNSPMLIMILYTISSMLLPLAVINSNKCVLHLLSLDICV